MDKQTSNEEELEAQHDTLNEPENVEQSSKQQADQKDTSSGFNLPFSIDAESSGNVGIREGIFYGFGLIVYIVGLLLVTSILSAIGGAFVVGGTGVDNIVITFLIGLFGFIISLTSLVVFFAGVAGLQYKIIADAVDRGNQIE